MKILITGGCGFIGSHLVDYLNEKHPDADLFVMDSLTYAGSRHNIDADPITDYLLWEMDICDRSVEKLVVSNNIDTIINLAADTHVDNSIKDASAFIHTNIRGVHNLLEIVRRHDTIRRFIHISTDEVYGSIEQGSFNEGANYHPGNPYSATKVGGDMLILSYINTYKIPAIIVRPTNNFGPKQFPEKLIPFFVKKLVKGENVPLYGDGMNVRDWLYVRDTCSAIDSIMERGRVGEIYNIAGENEQPNAVVVKKILEIMGLGEDRIEYVKDRPGHDRRYSLDCSKLKTEIGFERVGNFDENLRNTVLWFKNKFEDVD